MARHTRSCVPRRRSRVASSDPQLPECLEEFFQKTLRSRGIRLGGMILDGILHGMGRSLLASRDSGQGRAMRICTEGSEGCVEQRPGPTDQQHDLAYRAAARRTLDRSLRQEHKRDQQHKDDRSPRENRKLHDRERLFHFGKALFHLSLQLQQIGFRGEILRLRNRGRCRPCLVLRNMC